MQGAGGVVGGCRCITVLVPLLHSLPQDGVLVSKEALAPPPPK